MYSSTDKQPKSRRKIMKNLCKYMFATAALLFSVSAVAMETSNCAPVEDMITSPQFDQAGTSWAFAAKKASRKKTKQPKIVKSRATSSPNRVRGYDHKPSV
jgi:hypothetical protein